MVAHRDDKGVSIIDAVETLSSIVDLDFEQDLGVTKENRLDVRGQEVSYRTVHWLNEIDAGETIKLVRGTFRSVLRYLQRFYEDELDQLESTGTFEGVKTIMLLVGEAAKKLDRFSTLFRRVRTGSVTKLREYRQLQSFYKKHLAKRIEKGGALERVPKTVLGAEEMISTVKLRGKRRPSLKNAFVDMDTVRKDSEYELFCLRKEDGSHFYSPRLLRSLKLVSDFGEYFGEHERKDPLLALNMWKDKGWHLAARAILQKSGGAIDHFYHEAMLYKKRELVTCLGKAMMALLLSTNPRNLLRNNPVKSCGAYFQDFLGFLRDALSTREYRKLIAYPPKRNDVLGHCLLEVAHALCRSLYAAVTSTNELSVVVQELLDKGRHIDSSTKRGSPKSVVTDSPVADRLEKSYAAMMEVMKEHPNGPINKLVEVLDRRNDAQRFDSLQQENIPGLLYSLYVRNHRIAVLRLPSPTWQESINKAYVTAEFRGFLRAYKAEGHGRRHLLVNLQDRTSWRERRRCCVLEELQRHKDFKDSLAVVSLAMDTDFYNQIGAYRNLNHADALIDGLKEQLSDEHAGFYLPPALQRRLTKRWVNGVLHAIHKTFFGNRNVLTRQNRLDFIEMFYMMLVLKVVDLCGADSISFTCKDGVDVGATVSSELYCLMQLLNGRKMNSQEWEAMESILYLPAMMLRERNIFPHRLQRFASFVKLFETKVAEVGAKKFVKACKSSFKGFFEHPLLSSRVAFPQSPQ